MVAYPPLKMIGDVLPALEVVESNIARRRVTGIPGDEGGQRAIGDRQQRTGLSDPA
jgi:hypothetical protein